MNADETMHTRILSGWCGKADSIQSAFIRHPFMSVAFLHMPRWAMAIGAQMAYQFLHTNPSRVKLLYLTESFTRDGFWDWLVYLKGVVSANYSGYQLWTRYQGLRVGTCTRNARAPYTPCIRVEAPYTGPCEMDPVF